MIPDLVVYQLFHYLKPLNVLSLRFVCYQFNRIANSILFNHLNVWNFPVFVLQHSIHLISLEEHRSTDLILQNSVTTGLDILDVFIVDNKFYLCLSMHPNHYLELGTEDDLNIVESIRNIGQFMSDIYLLPDFKVILTITSVDYIVIFELNFQNDEFRCTHHIYNHNTPTCLCLLGHISTKQKSDWFTNGTHFVSDDLICHSVCVDQNEIVCKKYNLSTNTLIVEHQFNFRYHLSAVMYGPWTAETIQFVKKHRTHVMSAKFIDRIVVWFLKDDKFVKFTYASSVIPLTIIQESKMFHFAKTFQAIDWFIQICYLTNDGVIFASDEINLGFFLKMNELPKMHMLDNDTLLMNEKIIHVKYIKSFRFDHFSAHHQGLDIKYYTI